MTGQSTLVEFAGRKVWDDFREVSAFARNRAMALDATVVIRRVDEGWVLPYYIADWNGLALPEEDFEMPEYRAVEPYQNSGDGSTGLSSNCGESLMDGYRLFGRD